jgi:ankyrin repeat protein
MRASTDTAERLFHRTASVAMALWRAAVGSICLLVSVAPAMSQPRALPTWGSAEIARTESAVRDADTATATRVAARSKLLRERVSNGVANPVSDADQAANMGHYGFIWARPFGPPSIPGVSCALPIRDGRRLPLETAYVYVSDLVGDPTNDGVGAALKYAEAYNLAMLRRAGFPYPDLCRPWVAAAPRELEDAALSRAATWDRRPVGRTLNLSQAAREGTIAEVRRWLRSGASINQSDDLYMTPLAWAVLRDREDVAAVLLAAGADPLGGVGEMRLLGATPLKLAIVTRKEPLIRLFVTPTLAARLRPWPSPLVLAAAQYGPPALFQQFLSEPHEAVTGRRLRETAGRGVDPSLLEVVNQVEALKCWRTATPSDTVVELIALYGDSEPRDVTVEVGVHPVILALSAYTATEWRIDVRPGARLAGVLALGYDPPRASGLSPTVPVLFNHLDAGCEDAPPNPSSAQDSELQRLVLRVERMTGRSVTRIQFDAPDRRFTVRTSDGAPVPLPLFDVSTPIDRLRYSRLSDPELVSAIERRSPSDDAATAERQGSPGLIFRRVPFSAGYTLVPVGVVCQGMGGAEAPPVGLGLTTIGQLPLVSEPGPTRSAPAERALLDYATAYNRALVTLPEYRYRDVCAPGEPNTTGSRAVEITRWSQPMQRAAAAEDLSDAARNGDLKLIETLLQRGARIDALDPFRLTALDWAIIRGHENIALVLLDHGADPTDRAQTDDRLKPQALAKSLGRAAVLRALSADAPTAASNPSGRSP